MMEDIFIFIIVFNLLGGAFAIYFNWLLIQPRPDAVQMKAPPASPLPAPDQRLSLEFMQQKALAPSSQQRNNLPVLQQHRILKMAKHEQKLTIEQKNNVP